MDTVVSPRTLDARPIAPALFAHFVLRSANMQPMVDWYMTVLDMHVVKRNDFICFLTYDDEHHRLAIVNIAGLQAPDPRSGPGARRLHLPQCRRVAVDLPSPEEGRHRALPADPSRADPVDVLSRSRRQLGRAAGRLLQDQGRGLGLLPDRVLHEEPDRRQFRSRDSLIAAYEFGRFRGRAAAPARRPGGVAAGARLEQPEQGRAADAHDGDRKSAPSPGAARDRSGCRCCWPRAGSAIWRRT